jgi:hypothetical protein
MRTQCTVINNGWIVHVGVEIGDFEAVAKCVKTDI